MNSPRLAAFSLVALAMMSGCAKTPPPADSLPVPATTTAAPGDHAGATATKPAVTATTNPLVQFSVDPGQVYACDGRDRTVSTVKWQVNDPAVATVRIEVDTAKEPARKTFTNGGNVGEARTGNWVGAGVRFHLVDAATGKELATHEVTSLPCQ